MSDPRPCTCPLCGKPALRHAIAEPGGSTDLIACPCVGDRTYLIGSELMRLLRQQHPDPEPA